MSSSSSSFLTLVTDGLKNLIAPPRCMNCLAEGTWLCRECRAYLPPAVTSCIGCQQPSARGLVCPACKPNYTLTGVISAGQYSHPVFKRGVGWLKFKGVRSVAFDLASTLIPHLPQIALLEQLSSKAILVPIPLHPSRLRSRGFNQSEDISRAMSRYTGIPTHNLLVRTKSTWTQSHLPHDLRSQNLTDAFAINRDIIGRLDRAVQFLIIIDDVTTTGATLEAAAKSLVPHLPLSTRAWAATIARG